MDIDYVRQTVINQERFRNVDDQYTFYYDETNNIRRLYLTGSGLNVPQDNSFVLAGVAHVGEFDNKRFDPLFNSLLLQKSAKELKLKHIAKGGPFDMLKSSKLKKIFDWLNENEFYIHYLNLNPVYWSVVDIIDSIIGESCDQVFILSHLQLKGDFYNLAMSNRQVFLSQLSAFNYPNIDEAETVLALTNDDENNLMVSVLVEKFSKDKRTMALINKPNYSLLQSSLKIDDLIDPRMNTVSSILKHVHKGTIQTAYTLLNGEYEIIEAEIIETSELINKELKSANLPDSIRIGAVLREKEIIIPRSNFIFKEKDTVVFLAQRDQLSTVESMFRISPF